MIRKGTWMHSLVGAIGAWTHKPPDLSLIIVILMFVETLLKPNACSCSNSHMLPFTAWSRIWKQATSAITPNTLCNALFRVTSRSRCLVSTQQIQECFGLILETEKTITWCLFVSQWVSNFCYRNPHVQTFQSNEPQSKNIGRIRTRPVQWSAVQLCHIRRRKGKGKLQEKLTSVLMVRLLRKGPRGKGNPVKLR